MRLFCIGSMRCDAQTPRPLPALSVERLLFGSSRVGRLHGRLSRYNATGLAEREIVGVFTHCGRCVQGPRACVCFVRLESFLLKLVSAVGGCTDSGGVTVRSVSGCLGTTVVTFRKTFFGHFCRDIHMNKLDSFTLRRGKNVRRCIADFALVFGRSLGMLSGGGRVGPVGTFLCISNCRDIISRHRVVQVGVGLVACPRLFTLDVCGRTNGFVVREVEAARRGPEDTCREGVRV